VLILLLVPKYSWRSTKNCPVNVASLSLTTTSGKPWYFHTFWKYALPTRGECILLIGMTWAIFVNWSISSKINVAPSDSGRSEMKSIPIWVDDLQANLNRCCNPCLACLGILVVWQLLHASQYFLKSVSIFGQEKFLAINSSVLSLPKCPAILESCSDWIIQVHNFCGTYTRFSQWSMSSSIEIFQSTVSLFDTICWQTSL